MTRQHVWAGGLAVAAAMCFWSSVASAGAPTPTSVLNIDLQGTAGDLQVTRAEFIPIGHFSLPTIYVGEAVGDGGPNTDPTQNLWWDLEIKVTAETTAAQAGAMIAFDKDVVNQTRFRWTDYHMTLGMGLGPNFMPSDPSDGLYFKTDPAPMEKSGAFPNPPMYDNPIEPDNLWWLVDATTPGSVPPGVLPGQIANFWLGIVIPPSKFMIPPTGGPAMAVITLRQHATIPEPTSVALVGVALVGGGLLRRRTNRS
jgi:hypothetical protein